MFKIVYSFPCLWEDDIDDLRDEFGDDVIDHWLMDVSVADFLIHSGWKLHPEEKHIMVEDVLFADLGGECDDVMRRHLHAWWNIKGKWRGLM